MAVWRDDDPEIFKATVATAAEQLGVQQIAVEKDYWVCEVLRAIVGAHRDEVVFKGGTSLEKLRMPASNVEKRNAQFSACLEIPQAVSDVDHLGDGTPGSPGGQFNDVRPATAVG